MTVIRLAEHRKDPDEYDGGVCPCGEAWFELKGEYAAVCVTRTGNVTGYAGYLYCVSCGRPFGSGRGVG